MNSKQFTFVFLIMMLFFWQSYGMGSLKQVFNKKIAQSNVSLFLANPRIVSTQARHQHQEKIEKKNHLRVQELHELKNITVLKNEQKTKIKKSALWGFSSFNGLMYSVGFALNAELLQPFLGNTSDIVLGAACFSAFAAYHARSHASQASYYKKLKKAHQDDLQKIQEELKAF